MNELKMNDRNLEIKNHVLRSQGMIPGIVYGPDIKSRPVMLSRYNLGKAIRSDGEIYEIMLGKKKIMAKMHSVQREPASNAPMHFSLVQLSKGVKSEVEVPIELSGEPIGVQNGGVLVILKDSLNVEGKPSMIPEKLTGDITGLKIGDKITLKDLNMPNNIEAVADNDEVIAICQAPQKPEVNVVEVETKPTEVSLAV